MKSLGLLSSSFSSLSCSCVSERLVSNLTCSGAAKNEMGECRMDIVNSEIAYLGYYGSEAYGLTWKVCMGILGIFGYFWVFLRIFRHFIEFVG